MQKKSSMRHTETAKAVDVVQLLRYIRAANTDLSLNPRRCCTRSRMCSGGVCHWRRIGGGGGGGGGGGVNY